MAEEKHDFRLQLLMTAIILFVGWFAGWDMAKKTQCLPIETTIDTQIVEKWDTITIEKPYEIVRYIQRFDTIRIKGKTDTINQQTEIAVLSDSALVFPIESIIYQDSTENAKYKAYLSGYRAALDSIEINCLQTETIITKIEREKAPKIGIGVQLGVGVSAQGIAVPYLGIGIQYRLFGK